MRVAVKSAPAMLMLACAAVLAGDAPPPIPPDAARAVFAEADALCRADNGRLWGASLCAPLMLVDPATRAVVASQADAGGVLQASDGVFTGQLPADVNAANTATGWSGTRWTQLLWPLPDDPDLRATLLAHELFHHLQPRLAIGQPTGGDNAHLDTVEGRIALQLEWRALAAALSATTAAARDAAIADALALRAERYRRFPSALRDETALELNEGLAEYTGVVVAHAGTAARMRAALRDLDAHLGDPTFVRSFAYATGPAYGLLLDAAAPGWRSGLVADSNLAWMLRDAIHASPSGDVATIAARYDGAALRATETAREAAHRAQLARNRARFVDGPVLALAFQRMQVQFDPRNLQPLDGAGTVYPNLRISDAWGTLEVDGGALIRSDWSAVVVPAPASADARPLQGDGWRLELAPGWTLAPDARRGDWALVAPKTAP